MKNPFEFLKGISGEKAKEKEKKRIDYKEVKDHNGRIVERGWVDESLGQVRESFKYDIDGLIVEGQRGVSGKEFKAGEYKTMLHRSAVGFRVQYDKGLIRGTEIRGSFDTMDKANHVDEFTRIIGHGGEATDELHYYENRQRWTRRAVYDLAGTKQTGEVQKTIMLNREGDPDWGRPSKKAVIKVPREKVFSGKDDSIQLSYKHPDDIPPYYFVNALQEMRDERIRAKI